MKDSPFTMIPKSILGQSWANNPIAMYLYTWLSINADSNGQIVTSVRQMAKLTKLSIQQVRTAYAKLLSTQVVTQVVTQASTQVTTVVTVSYLATSKGSKKRGNTSSNTSCNTSSNTTSCAYKNDNIISCLSRENINNPPNPPRGYEAINFSFVEERFLEVLFEWLEYKRAKGQSYKDEKSLTLLYKKLLEYSDNDTSKAKEVVEQSMANNWNGLFRLKTEKRDSYDYTQLRDNNDPDKFKKGFSW